MATPDQRFAIGNEIRNLKQNDYADTNVSLVIDCDALL